MSETQAEIRRRIVTAAMEVAATGGWRRATLDEIAGSAGLETAELRKVFPTKHAIIAAFILEIDDETLDQDFGFETEDTIRDRLFEILMSRFDRLGAHRPAIAAISRDLPTDPLGVLCLAPGVFTSMSRALDAAGIPTRGPLGMLRAKGLLAVWLATLRIWLDDDSPDASRTMAALDRNLRRAEQAAMQLDSVSAPGTRKPRPETHPTD